MKNLFEYFPTLLGLSGTHEILGLSGITQSDKQSYVSKFYPMAKMAGEKFGLNPIVILAQGGIESGWGTSYMARNVFNFFGITASGKPNDFWKGDTYISKSSGLKFRKYDSPQNCFYDFARLISSNYLNATRASYSVADYAREISLSPYAEQDPVNREIYRTSIIGNAAYILKAIGNNDEAEKLTAETKKTNSNPSVTKTENTSSTERASNTTDGNGSGGTVALVALAAGLLLFGFSSHKPIKTNSNE